MCNKMLFFVDCLNIHITLSIASELSRWKSNITFLVLLPHVVKLENIHNFTSKLRSSIDQDLDLGKMGCVRCTKKFFTTIRYMPEFLGIIYLFGVMLSSPVYEQFYYKRYSERYGYNWTMSSSNTHQGCQSNNTADPELKKVQDSVSSFLSQLAFCFTVPSIIVGLFYGPLSDRIGRKPILFVNIFGFFIHSVLIIFVDIFDLDTRLILFGAICFGLGGHIGMLASIFGAYLSDVVNSETLSFRIGVVQMILLASVAMSNYVSGFLLERFGFLWSFIFIASLTAAALLLCIFQLGESLAVEDRAEQQTSMLILPRKIWLLLKAPRSRKWRLHFLIPLDMMSFFCGQTVIGPILLLRLLNQPFCWSPSNIGIFRGTYFLTSGIGSPILIALLPMVAHKSFVILAAFISIAAYMALFGFALSPNALYVSIAAGIFSYAVSPMTRGILSNTVNATERGALFSLMGSLQSVMILVGTYFFQALYRHFNRQGHPGAAFVIGSIIIVVPVLFFLFYAFKEIRDERRRKHDEACTDYEHMVT